MKSFALVKTNVGLTSNVKIMVDSNYNLYLNSIDSAIDLSNALYKKFNINPNSLYDEVISKFWNNNGTNLNTSTIFSILYENDNNIMYNSFDKQIDDLYICGADDITDNKYYTEDYEYFAPLYISKTGLPKYFVIFRIDGPGINNVNSNNFDTEIIDKLKVVKVFNLTQNSPIGMWLYNNITNNTSFPLSAFEMDFRRSHFSYWNGIDIQNGCFTQKPYLFDPILDYENTFNDLEKFVYDGYAKNNIIFPNILNLSFLFDDQPATPTSLRNFGLNRYSGFYLDDLILSTNVSTYLPSIVKTDAYITTNNIITNTNNTPFSDSTLKQQQIYIEIAGIFYPVNKINNNYQIISNINLVGLTESSINKNIISIDNNNKISYINGNSFVINDFDTADVWLINIGNLYHTLQFNNNDYYIYSDYGFNLSSNTLTYYINYPSPSYSTTINIYNGTSSLPTSFGIYKCNFTEIKQLDNSIVNTDFAKIEYDTDGQIITTDEPKMYMDDLNTIGTNKCKVDFSINGNAVSIPTTSHYTANNETFKIVNDTKTNTNNDLNILWRKNSIYTKWGFKNSLSVGDYPYLLNNSFTGEDFNKCPNTYLSTPNRSERNLDYFYSINSTTTSYAYHSLHIEEIQNNTIIYTYSFDINAYLYSNYDYFSLFFDRKVYLNNSTTINNTQKFSLFNSGDNTYTPNTTLFKGIKINIFDVDSVKISNNILQNINIKNNNTYEDYKFSILLSDNPLDIKTNNINLNNVVLTASNNTLEWYIIDSFKRDVQYHINDIVNYTDILYIAGTDSYVNDPNITPANSGAWNYFTNSIFWSPTSSYTTYSGGNLHNIVYNSGEYYYNNGMSSNTFYNPSATYSYNAISLFNNTTFISTTGNNGYAPNSNNIWRDAIGNAYFYWNEITTYDSLGSPNTQWTIIQLWDNYKLYSSGNLVIYNNILYYLISSFSTIGVNPKSSNNWVKLYSIQPQINYAYNNLVKKNNVLLINNRYYLCISNTNNSYLDNGINIYINNIYKNVLINIYVNDNTLNNINNEDRDALYKDIYSNLTAFNFINAVNDITNNYNFANKVKYITINTNGVKIYDFDQLNSYKNITTLLTMETPDQFSSRILSLQPNPVNLNSSQYKSNSKLNKGTITYTNQINHYNDLAIGNTIDYIKYDATLITNYSGIQNKIYNILYRHSGFYEPICKSIQLFQKGLTYSGNLKFDTRLTDFGIIKEMIVSKVNRNGSVLQLSNSNLKSIYPQLDEFGYTTKDHFMFKSSFDANYFLECTPVVLNATNQISNNPVVYNSIAITPKKLM